MPQSYSPVYFPQDFSPVSMSAANKKIDSCSDNSEDNVGNYCTITTLFTREISSYSSPAGSITVSNGGLTVNFANGGTNPLCITTQPLLPGNKYHFEWETNAWGSDALTWAGVWLIPLSVLLKLGNINASGGKGYYLSSWNPSRGIGSNTAFNGSTLTSIAAADAWGVGEVLSFDVDMSTIGSTDIIAKLDGSTIATNSSLAFNDEPYFICPQVQSNGSNRTWNGTFNFGASSFTTTPVSGHTGINTSIISTPTVTNPSNFFKAVTFSGTGSAQNIDTLGFRPDLLIIKSATSSANWNWVDSVRGASELLWSNASVAQSEETSSVTGFRDAGFSVGSDTGSYVNISGQTMVTYGLKAGGATTSSNGEGSITSEVTVASHGGFSIAKYTGTGANATFGHGCSRAPKFILVRAYEQAYGWTAWHEGLTTGDYIIYLSGSAAESDQGGIAWQSTPPSSSVITLGSQTGQNGSGQVHICYSFARTPGLIGIGSYTGNGNADGPMVVVDDGASGFKPAWIMFKNVSQAGYGWSVFDVARDTIGNPNSTALAVNNATSNSSVASYKHDLLANGFKIRGNSGETNYSGNTIIYLAFAENPFAGSTIDQAKAR
jgi:hypothetical protein